MSIYKQIGAWIYFKRKWWYFEQNYNQCEADLQSKKCNIIKYSALIIAVLFPIILSAQISGIPKFSPLPDMSDNDSNVRLNLNGNWLFNPEPGNEFPKKLNLQEWRNILVPGEWYMQGFSVREGLYAGYYRKFNVPEEWKDKIIKLRCDGIYSGTIIYINGKYAGAHEGGFNAFEIDVTDHIAAGKENNIGIAVQSETMSDTLASATQYAAHQLGGITRKIYLIAVPKIHVSSLELNTEFDKKYADAKLKMKLSIFNGSSRKIESYKIKVNLYSPSGNRIELGGIREIKAEAGPGGEVVSFLEFNVSRPEKWDAENPNLYKLNVDFSAGRFNEKFSSKIGFRHIEVIGNKLFVNGNPVKLKGANRHEVHPLLGRSLNEEIWKKDALLFKGANCNYIRTSHYPPAEEFINYCDEIGLFVELENPFCWVGHAANERWKTSDPKSNKLLSSILRLTKETVQFYRNHPSIIIWSLANESAWTDNWKQTLDMINTLDPSRPKSFHDQSYGEYNNYGSIELPIANYHYPSPVDISFTRKFSRPLLFGEYAHINTYNRQEIVADPGVRDSWGRGFEPFVEDMYYAAGNLGGAVWSGIDDVFHLKDGRAVGYGEWGIIDGWRRIKPEYWHMKKSYSPVKVHNSYIPVPDKGEHVKLILENRFDFTSFDAISIDGLIGDKKIKINSDLKPHETGVAQFLLPEVSADGMQLQISFRNKNGDLIDQVVLPVGSHQSKKNIHETKEKFKVNYTEDAGTVVVNAGKYEWHFQKTTGRINKASLNGKTIITDGPGFMLIPLSTGPCNTEHKADIEPLNPISQNWKLGKLSVIDSLGGVSIKVEGSWDDAGGKIVYLIDETGKMTISYSLICKVDINPRQWGLLFALPNKYENLTWSRKGQWSYYPDNHIGRSSGSAVPFGPLGKEIKIGQEPDWEWRYDRNKMGSNDFRATRDNIYYASLRDQSGLGIMIISDGSDAFRSFVENGEIKFLVAPFSTGGGDMFFSTHLTSERRPLKPGSKLNAKITLILTE